MAEDGNQGSGKARVAFPFRRAWVVVAALLVMAAESSRTRADDETATYAFHHENVLGTMLEIQVRAGSEPAARQAEARVLEVIERLNRVFSGYDSSSEFQRWQSRVGEPVVVSAELFDLLAACDRWREATQGAFHPEVVALSQLWRASERAGRLPSAAEIAAACPQVESSGWTLDRKSQTATRARREGLTLNAIATGTIVDEACRAAMVADPDVTGVLINLGGDLKAVGDLNARVAIPDARSSDDGAPALASLLVRDRAVVTSGVSSRGYQIGVHSYSHLIDPRTGWPVEHVRSATVIADRAEDADALATALCVMPVDAGLRLVAELEGVECLLVMADGEIERSAGMAGFEEASTPEAVRQDDPAAQAMTIEFEINRPDEPGQRYRRPYVAVWFENARGEPVRTVLMFISFGGPGPQWVPDLKRWYRGDVQRRKTDKKDVLYTVSTPTRPPGKYKVVWDGKDDHGQPLPEGEYTLMIEAAREHGTYQLIREKVSLGGEAYSKSVEGNIEIKGANVTYGPATRE